MDFESLDPERDAIAILARTLERGGLVEVQWAMRHYGMARIHEFFRDVGHPELSDRTIGFWRAVYRAKDDEKWASPPGWRRDGSAPWID
jgi:hypothetical protein